MKCSKCGKNIADDSHYCEYCGKSLKISMNPWIVISIIIAIVSAIWIFCLYRQNQEDQEEIKTKVVEIENIQNDKTLLEKKVEDQNTYINMISEPAQIYVMRSHGRSEIHFCNGVILDPGGTDYYSNDCDSYLVISPDISPGYDIKIQGPFEIENCCDYIDVYDGTSTDGELLKRCKGNGKCDVTSSTGNLFIHFHSDGSVVQSGFVFTVSCVPVEN